MVFFSCTVIQINPIKSLINALFFPLVSSCGLHGFLNMFSALHFKWMPKVCLFRIAKKVSSLQPVFRFRLSSCKTNFIKIGLLVTRPACSPAPTFARCGLSHFILCGKGQRAWDCSSSLSLEGSNSRQFSGSAKCRTMYPQDTSPALLFFSSWTSAVPGLPVLYRLESSFLSQMFLNLM